MKKCNRNSGFIAKFVTQWLENIFASVVFADY